MILLNILLSSPRLTSYVTNFKFLNAEISQNPQFYEMFQKRLCTIILLGICINIKLHLCMQVLGLSVCIHAFDHINVLIPYNPFLFFLLPPHFTQTCMYHYNSPLNYMIARDFAIFFVMK